MTAPQITQPGIYTMDAADYLADPCPAPSLNNSVGKHFITGSPAHVWAAHPRLGNMGGVEPTAAMSLGSAAHSVILENSWAPIVFVDAPNFTTKAAREQRDAANAAGLFPVLEKDRETLQAMVFAMQEAEVFVGPGIKEECFAYEKVLIWQEMGCWFRCRVDAIYGGNLGGEQAPDVIYDLKTTGLRATPDGWGRTAIWDYALQAAFYSRGYEIITGQTPEFRFVVQETKPPYAVRQFEFDTIGVRYGKALAHRVVHRWTECMRSGEWLSYPTDIHTAQAPQWIIRELEGM